MLATWGANQGFSPSSLFSAGEQGTWYDPSDLTTLFQDAAGTTPVTAVEQPVGLMLDKSKGLVLGPELVTNGDFSNGTTGWVATHGAFAVVGGRAEITGASGFYPRLRQAITTTAGRWYKVSVPYEKGTYTGPVYMNFGSDVSSNAASGTLTGYFLAGGASTTITVGEFNETATGTVYFDNISVRELLGNHAYQTTSANRPTLSARYNLLTKTEQFDDAAWSKSGVTVSANAIAAPDGTLTADKVVETTGTVHYGVYVETTLPNSTSNTYSVYAKAGERTWLSINTIDGASRLTWFNLSDGTIGTKYSGHTASITSVGSGWYRCSVTYTRANGAQYVCLSPSAANNVYNYTGDGTSGIYIWGADIRVANDGVGIPAYQRVNTATDYDTVGFPKYLSFNGSSRAMLTNSIDFTGTDKMTVWAGVRKLSDAAAATVAELSVNSGTTGNTFAMFAPGTVAPNYAFRSSGTLDSVATATSFMAPVTNVLAGLGGIASDTAILRVNGTQVASSVADQGTGSFGTYPLYIGARAGTSLWFNGRIYSLIIRGAQSTTAQITNTEKYVNSKTKAY